MLLTSSLLFIYLVAATDNSCLTSSDEYAVEAVIPDIMSGPILDLEGQRAGSYIAESAYSKQLLVILQRTSFPTGLSVRLQIPTKEVVVTKPRIKLISSSASGTLKDNVGTIFNGWKIVCTLDTCTFEKDLITITSPKKANSGVTVEISSTLVPCSAACSGICIEGSIESKCVDARMRTDLDVILRYSNISVNFKELLESYRIVGSEDLSLTDIQPANSIVVDWEEAMRQQLDYLVSTRVLDMEHSDIEKIAALMKKGQAGQNYRVVYDEQSKEWTYYNNLPDAVLSTARDCNEYSLSRNQLINKVEDSPNFYLIPMIIGTAGIVLLLILLVIGRLVNASQNGRRRKSSRRNI